MHFVFAILSQNSMSSGAKLLKSCIISCSIGSGPRGENGLHELWSIKDVILCFQISCLNHFSSTSIPFPSLNPSSCEPGDNLQDKSPGSEFTMAKCRTPPMEQKVFNCKTPGSCLYIFMWPHKLYGLLPFHTK